MARREEEQRNTLLKHFPRCSLHNAYPFNILMNQLWTRDWDSAHNCDRYLTHDIRVAPSRLRSLRDGRLGGIRREALTQRFRLCDAKAEGIAEAIHN